MSCSEEDISKMSTLLASLLQNDTAIIRSAEETLKPLLKDPRCVPALLEILKGTSSQSVSVRHVAAVLLRKRLPNHFKTFDPNTKTYIKSEILLVLQNEPERIVRLGTIGVASSIAKKEAEAAESAGGGVGWTELLTFISQAASNPNPDASELAFLLLSEMTEIIGENCRDQFPSLAGLFQASLVPGVPSKVQHASVAALGSLLSVLVEEDDESVVAPFAALLPSVLSVALSPEAGSEEMITTVLDMLYDMCWSNSSSITGGIVLIVKFALHCLANPNLEMTVRDSAALVVATLAESKPKTLGSRCNIEEIVECLFNLIENSNDSAAGALFENNPAWREDMDNTSKDGRAEDDDADERDWDSPTATSMAQGTLDMLACELPKKYIYQPVMSRCVTRLSSTNSNQRKAGIACLGVIAEGCTESMREHLPEVVPHVLHAAGDSEAQVRECACFALGQLSEHCQPEILAYSNQILPIVFALLDDTTVQVQATSCYVLEMFCERLEPSGVRPLLDSLVRKLASMLESSTKRSVQEMAVAAMAATAVAAEEEFAPYVPGVAQLMSKLLELREATMYTLRGRALECMGHVAIAVGKENFRPYFQQTMQCACEGLTFDCTELHEFAYAVFANLSKVMGEEFAPVLGELVPHLIDVIKMDEGQFEQAEATGDEGKAFNSLDDSDDEENADNYILHVRTALLDSKKGAITAIGEMASHTGAAFVPFLEEVMAVLQTAAKNWHPLIKAESAEALSSMVVPSVAAHHGGTINWTKGDISGANPMSPHTNAVVSAVLGELLKLMDDDDKGAVGKACEGIQSVLELCGPHALMPVSTDCLTKTHALLARKSPCQMAEEAEGEVEGGDLLTEDDDHDTFMTSVCDLVGTYGRIMGPHFAKYLNQFLPAICAYAKQSRPSSDRSMAVGCLGEIAQELGVGISEHFETIFYPASLACLADEDDNVKRNAAFTIGVCCEGLGELVVSQYPQILSTISPLFQIDSSASDQSAACVDNAAAAVSRMITTCPQAVQPMNQVLPVLLKALPLKNDMTENETVYKCLLGLLQANHPDVAVNKAEFLRVFQSAMAEGSNVDDELKVSINQALAALA